MKTVIFCGPSLTRSRLKQLTPSDVADPIRRGDLDTCGEYDVFLILDGEFAQSLSVSPKEILRIIGQGKVVIGASSMGALRASELNQQGMIGIGWIYDRFARAMVRRDDEVALTYSPTDFTPHTVPLVNVEYWMERGTAEGYVSARERAQIVQAARRIFFAERSEKRLMVALEKTLGRDRLTHILNHTSGRIPDIKAIDAERAVLFAARIKSPTNLNLITPGNQLGSQKESSYAEPTDAGERSYGTFGQGAH
jgi:TfuA protein